MQITGQEELIYLNAFNCMPFLGPKRITALISAMGSAKQSWQSSEEVVKQVEGFENIAVRLFEEKRKIDPPSEWEKLYKKGIKCIATGSAEYPVLLKQLTCPPPVLYYRGNLKGENNQVIAIVGSRRATFYGKEVAQRLAGELTTAGVSIVSGMALGVDTAAHIGCLENNGYTIAVLGCGLDHCYPPSNKDLMEQIASSGTVMSEFPLGTRPLPGHFPQRNRIISGLSLGTVVVEATAKSGSLITANYALEENREVFAVPGNIGSPYSRGCHQLIREGAHLVESASDILNEILIDRPAEEQLTLVPTAQNLNSDEKKVLSLIPYQPMHIDDLIKVCGNPASEIISTLLSLELKKLVRQTPGKYFCRI